MKITLPNNWKARDYQQKAWDFMYNGGKHLELIWHRRSGKDDVALNLAACKIHERIGTYWHMLPMASQVRKAIWHAIDPHTGIRRIDQAFPRELREKTLEQEMMIKFKNGSTWQALGSDNYDSVVGSPPVGIVYSEWALANPQVRGYLRPIIRENGGWQAFISTPRGRNHAHKTYNAALKRPGSFAQLLTVNDTGAMTLAEQEFELQEYIDTYGYDHGKALFEQEYLCSFDAAILGSYYGGEMAEALHQGRICQVEHDPDYPVHVTSDIGRTDDTSLWFFQVIGNEIRVLEAVSESGKDPDWFCSQILGHHVIINFINGNLEIIHGVDMPDLEHRRAYNYGSIWIPHDAKAKTFVAKGKSVQEQVVKAMPAGTVHVTPHLSLQDGIQAGRNAMNRAVFDTEGTELGRFALGNYRRNWDGNRQCFADTPYHDWSSNLADAWRYAGVVWRSLPEEVPRQEPVYARQMDKRFQLDKLFKDNESGHSHRVRRI